MKLFTFITGYSTAVLMLSVVLSGCGGDGGSSPTAKAAVANLDGQYKLTQMSCTVGELAGPAKAMFQSIPFTVSIKGSVMSIVGKISDTCSLTQALTISELTSNSIATVEGATTCSSACTPEQGQASAASNKKESDSYSMVNNVLTVIGSAHDEVCQDSSGRLVHSYTKQ